MNPLNVASKFEERLDQVDRAELVAMLAPYIEDNRYGDLTVGHLDRLLEVSCHMDEYVAISVYNKGWFDVTSPYFTQPLLASQRISVLDPDDSIIRIKDPDDPSEHITLNGNDPQTEFAGFLFNFAL